mgnify:CR=1 FL=1
MSNAELHRKYGSPNSESARYQHQETERESSAKYRQIYKDENRFRKSKKHETLSNDEDEIITEYLIDALNPMIIDDLENTSKGTGEKTADQILH